MSKQKNNPPRKDQKIVQPKLQVPEAQINYRLFPFPNHWLAYIVLALVSFAIYFNSIQNENALDDGIIIQKNEFVLKGTKGIKDIMTHDSYYSFYRQMNAEDQLSGGRYRPLSVVTFAIEQQFIGPYKNGTFQKFVDKNKNGKIEPDSNEVNYWADSIQPDGIVQDFECTECWDKNHNFKKDTLKINGVAQFQADTISPERRAKGEKGAPVWSEDINKDGNVNDKDCEVEGHTLRHTMNVLFYALSILVIFGLLKNHLFRDNHDLAFLAALLFAIHPIHTEVVANVKSRDEILSIIFIVLTLSFSFKYMETKKMKDMWIAGFMFFLSVLAKEYALTLIPLIPLTFYVYRFVNFNTLLPVANKSSQVSIAKIDDPETGNIVVRKGTFSEWIYVIFINHLKPILFSLAMVVTAYAMYKLASKHKSFIPVVPIYIIGTFVVFFKEFKNKTALALMVVLSQVLMIYLGLRFNAVTLKPAVPDTEILNNPYLKIQDIPSSLWATKIFVLLKYIGLLFYPDPLSSDYSYNTILPRTFKSWDTLLSLLVYGILLAVTFFYTFIKRNKVVFASLFFFANLLMVGNVLFDIGATMGERLVFHSSLGVTIFIAWLFTDKLGKVISSVQAQRMVVILATLVICGWGGYKTWKRNYDWKNDITLFCHDVGTVPNSVLVLGNAGARWIDKSEWPENVKFQKDYLKKAKGYLLHALDLHPNYVNGYLNLGLAYYKLDDLDSATITWKNAELRYPTNPYLNIYYGVLVPRLMAEANQKNREKDYSKAVHYMQLATQAQPNNPEVLYNMGGAYFSSGQLDSAKVYFQKTLTLKPDYKLAQDGLNAIVVQQSGGNVVVMPGK